MNAFVFGELPVSLARMDNSGYIIAFVGYAIVFIALVSLYGVFYYIPKLSRRFRKRTLTKQGKMYDLHNEDMSLNGDVNAAIGAAIFIMMNEQHDDESNIITIKKVSKTYSPWSSKIYGLQQFHRN